MLASFASKLPQLRVILASQSPRRQEILRFNLGINFEVVVSGFAEDIDKNSCRDAEDYVAKTCRMKAVAVTSQILESGEDVDVIIAADTIVVQDNVILEKPQDFNHAVSMLSSLSGSEHNVLTAVTIALNSSRLPSISPELLNALGYDKQNGVSSASGDGFVYKTFVTSTAVQFAHLSEEVIRAYVSTGEPMDKAGAYGIQGIGSSLVESIRGCYFNVVGFPIHRFAKEFGSVLKSI